MASTIQELKEVLKSNLEQRGVLNKERARIRAEIFASLNEMPADRSKLPNENAIINELIREYFMYNNLNNSLAVLIPESGQPQIPLFTRNQLAAKLKVIEDPNSKSLPLIYSLAFGAKKLLENQDIELKDSFNAQSQSQRQQPQQKVAADLQENERQNDSKEKKIYENIFQN